MKQLNIRQHVGALALMPLLIMAFGLEAYFLSVRTADLEGELVERGKLIANQLAASSEYGVFSNNQAFLKNITLSTLQQADVRGVMIMNGVTESLAVAGEFYVEEEAMLTGSDAARYAGQTGLLPISKVKGLVNSSRPIISSGNNLWLYQPILPMQVELDDFRDKTLVKPVGAVILEISKERTHQLQSHIRWVMAGVTMGFMTLAVALAYLVSRRITVPVRELSRVVQSIGSGRLETRAPKTMQVRELDILARGINSMAAQLEQEYTDLHRKMEETTRIAAIAFESHEGMMVTDAEAVIMQVNGAFSRITGYASHEAVGQTPRFLQSGRHHQDFFAEMWNSIVSVGIWHGEIWNRHKNGEIYPAWVSITAVKNAQGATMNYVATYTDITLRKAIENEVKSLAYYDELTKLPNRRTFTDRLGQAMAVSKRSGCYGAVMFIDLDNFKPLNDQHGHAVGDALLVEVAQRLIGCVREEDTVSRFGGDEFVVMLRELAENKEESIAQSCAIAEKILTILGEPYLLPVRVKGVASGQVSHHCTASIGVTLFINHQASLEDILKCADMAMYQAKRDGRNVVRYYSAPGSAG